MSRKTVRGFIVPDTHAPYVSEKAFGEALYAAKQWAPGVVVTLGDFVDCYSVSGHSKDPSRHAIFARELADAAGYLRRLEAATPKAKVRHWLDGNHEHRLARYIHDRAPALHGMVSLYDAMGLKANGWRVTPYNQLLKLGKMHFTHDLGKAGPGAARHALQAVQGNVVIGHTHRLEVVYEGNAKGECHVGCSLGWLGDIAAIDYRHRSLVRKDWVHAYGTFEMLPSGVVKLSAHPIF